MGNNLPISLSHSESYFPCGCIPGQKLCNKAEMLWKEVDKYFFQLNLPHCDQVEFETAMNNYWNHFQIKEVAHANCNH